MVPPTGRLPIIQPAPFLQHTGDLPLSIGTWFTTYSAYLTLVEAERGVALEHLVKNSMLFSLLGTEGQRRFASHPIIATIATATHEAFQAAMKTFFKKPVNIARACLDFREHRQGQSKTASKFVSALSELALDCSFPVDYLNRELALQILSGCHSTKV